MDKNTKILFGVGIVAFAYHEYILNKVVNLLNRMAPALRDHLEEDYQDKVDAVFEDIADNYDN